MASNRLPSAGRWPRSRLWRIQSADALPNRVPSSTVDASLSSALASSRRPLTPCDIDLLRPAIHSRYWPWKSSKQLAIAIVGHQVELRNPQHELADLTFVIDRRPLSTAARCSRRRRRAHSSKLDTQLREAPGNIAQRGKTCMCVSATKRLCRSTVASCSREKMARPTSATSGTASRTLRRLAIVIRFSRAVTHTEWSRRSPQVKRPVDLWHATLVSP